MILFFDVETTGLLQDQLPIEHPDQPSIVQLATQLRDDDGTALGGFCLIVNPGRHIPEQASAVHGIDDKRAAMLGVKPATALGLFAHLYERADLLVAHNIKFYRGLIDVAYTRHRPQAEYISKPLFCTMEAAAPIVNLPPTERMRAAGFTKPKPPKLAECVQHFFGEPHAGAHDAMADVAACARVYFHIKGLAA